MKGTDLGHHRRSPVGKLELFVVGDTGQGGDLLHDFANLGVLLIANSRSIRVTAGKRSNGNLLPGNPRSSRRTPR